MPTLYDELDYVIQGSNGYIPGVNYDTRKRKDTVDPTDTVKPTDPTPLAHSPEYNDTLRLNYNFQPNILDNYDNITYHFKLFMLSLQDTRDGNIFNLSAQTIIAESGVSDLTIDNVELSSVATPIKATGTGIQTTLKFEIIEPSGANLLDKMYYKSIELGIGNWANMTTFLQLEFRGRNINTSSANNDLSKLRWIWKILITDIKSTVTHVGTHHTFTAVTSGEAALSNIASGIKSNITLTNLTTFKDAVRQLEEKLNRDQLLGLINLKSIPDVYRFKIDPKIENYTFSSDNNNSARNNSNIVIDNKSATFPVATGIDVIIDTLLGHTKEYQKLLINSKTPGGQPESVRSNSQMKGFWRIIPEMRPIEYDPRCAGNANEYVYYIIYYDLGVVDASITQTSNITSEVSKKRYIEYTNKGLLRKKYNYVFTGLNDQVINLDFSLNAGFAVAVNRANALYSNPGLRDYGATANANSEKTIEFEKAAKDLITLQNNAQTSGESYTKAIEDYKNSAKAANLSKSQRGYYDKLIAVSKNKNLDLKVFGKNYDPSKKPVEKVDTGVLSFISDVDITSKTASNTYNAYAEKIKKRQTQWPIRFVEGIQNHSLGRGIETDNNVGKDKLATVFSLALHGDGDASLISIAMTIKGDPFWLFPPPTSSQLNSTFLSSMPDKKAIATIKSSIERPNAVNLYGADNFLFIRLRTPRLFNLETNINDANSNTNVEVYSGVYKVITVKSKFEKGKFTQTLNCNLDYSIKTDAVQNLIEQMSKEIEKPTTINDLTTNPYYSASKSPVNNKTIQEKLQKRVRTN